VLHNHCVKREFEIFYRDPPIDLDQERSSALVDALKHSPDNFVTLVGSDDPQDKAVSPQLFTGRVGTESPAAINRNHTNCEPLHQPQHKRYGLHQQNQDHHNESAQMSAGESPASSFDLQVVLPFRLSLFRFFPAGAPLIRSVRYGSIRRQQLPRSRERFLLVTLTVFFAFRHGGSQGPPEGRVVGKICLLISDTSFLPPTNSLGSHFRCLVSRVAEYRIRQSGTTTESRVRRTPTCLMQPR
jgi:hypothetical protein